MSAGDVPSTPTTPASTGGTSLVEGYEQREIILARGVEFNHEDHIHAGWNIPEDLTNRISGELVADGANTWVYRNDTQQVDYTLRVINTRVAFQAALETEGAMVIYGGHSRYGRGACFGTQTSPGDQWESGDPPESSDNGIFRLGFPYVAVETDDITHHGYHFSPIAVENPRPPTDRQNCERHHDLVSIALPEEYRHLVKTEFASPSHHYWGFREAGKINLLMRAGYENTESDPYELGATEMSCRCFCHFGCSSFDHFYPVVRRLFNWRRDGNNRFAYWTTQEAVGITPILWIQHLFSYNQPSGGLSWQPLLEYALRQTNRSLREELLAAGFHRRQIHQII